MSSITVIFSPGPLTESAVKVAGRRELPTPGEERGRWRDLNSDARAKQLDHKQRYQEKYCNNIQSIQLQQEQQQQQQQQQQQHQQGRRQQPNTPRRRHQRNFDKGLRGTLGSSPRPATALPWTNAQADGQRFPNNNADNNYSTAPLSSRDLSPSVPRSARQRKLGLSAVPSASSTYRHPAASRRSSAGVLESANSTGRVRGGFFSKASAKNVGEGNNTQGVDDISKSKSKNKEVSRSNPYRNFCANLISYSGSFSIPSQNDTSSSSANGKINANQTVCISFDKQSDTGVENNRTAGKGTSLELRQSLYEDEFNQAASSPVYLQLLKATSTSKYSGGAGGDELNVDSNKGRSRPQPVRRKSVGVVRPRSQYTIRDRDEINARKGVHKLSDGVISRRHSNSNLLSNHNNSNVISNDDTEIDSGSSVVDQIPRTRFYFEEEDDDDQDIQDNVDGDFDEDNDDEEDDSDNIDDLRSDSVTQGLRQAKRGSVTFDVPDEEKKSRPFSVQGQFAGNNDLIRRMSAPELPPIADVNAKPSRVKGDKRKTSTNSVASSGSKASMNQLAAAVNNKTFYNRKVHNNSSGSNQGSRGHKKKKLPIPRNHSDSSLKGLIANNSNQSQDSGGSATEAGGVLGGPVTKAKFLANGHRALSWCATENSGSQTKLETLFEGQNIISGTKANGSLNYAHNNSGSSSNLPNYVTNGGGSPDNTMPAIPPRSVSVNGIRNRDELSRLVYNNNIGSRTLKSDAGDVEISPVDDFVSRGRMRRSLSENKLGGGKHFSSTNSLNSNNNNNSNNNKYNNANSNTDNRQKPGKPKQKHFQRGMTRNLSVDRIDKLTSKPLRKQSTPSYVGAKNAQMRRVNSVSALNTSKTPYYTSLNTNSNNNNNNSTKTLNRNESNQEDVFDDEEDEECLEASARLVEWLNVVNNVDEYDTDPKDTVIEYADEPPQTDTAVHVVYGGDK